MPEDQLKAFLQVVRLDAALRQRLQDAASSDDVEAMADEYGFDVTALDWLRYRNAESPEADQEIGDHELEIIAGGETAKMYSNPQTCANAPNYCGTGGTC